MVLSLLVLSACGGVHRPAPVRNLSVEPVSKKVWKSGQYRVRKSDTLYSIAFRFGLDFQSLARINQIQMPYTIYPGQILRLRYSKKSRTTKKKQVASTTKPVVETKTNKNVAKQQTIKSTKKPSNNKTKGIQRDSSFDHKKKVTAWRWPVKNKQTKKFSLGNNEQQGLDISGRLGEPIRSTAAGRVVYSGNGLVGYGNLIILKHSQSYLSAYAHNDKLLVREQDVVKAGQKIATMGKNGTGQVQLHFEIRYQGRPVNPLKYLPSSD